MNDNSQYIVPLVTGKPEIINNYSVFDEIIGQEEPCKKLSFLVRSHSEITPFPTLLMTGSQGLGKSHMANQVAMALGRQLIEVNCATCKTVKNFIEDVLFGRVLGDCPKTILLDEAHELSSDITTLLLSMLNPNKDNTNLVPYKNWIIECNLLNVNFILASTHSHKIFSPLKNRSTEIYFRPYTSKELFKILKMYLPDISLKCNRKALSQACRGRARDAVLLAQNIKRYCVMRSSKELSNEGWKELSGIFGIHEEGLTSQEVELLNVLKLHSPISCHNLSVALMVNENNIESEIEVRPRELGFIANGPKGRYLTKEGEKYLEKAGK